MKPTKRFLRILTLFATLCCLTVGALAKGEEYAPFSGQELDAEAPRFQDGVKRGVLTYPFETYYGDSLYILSYRVNESGETIRNFQKERIVGHNLHFYEVTITSKDIDLSHEWAFERQSVYAGDVKYAFMPGNFEPGVRETGFYTALDFPPLEDWNDPFWKDLREKMTPEGVKCTLSFRLGVGHAFCSRRVSLHELGHAFDLMDKTAEQDKGVMSYKGIYTGLSPENLEFEDFELRLIQSKSKPV